MKKICFIIRELWSRVGDHNLTAYSAQMAYFFLLSIFPFLITLFAVLGKLQITYDVFSTAYARVVPMEAYSIIDSYIKGLLAANLEAVLPLSLLASLITASRAVNALERALNMAHEVPHPRKYWHGRLLGVVTTTFLMLILIIALTLPSMGERFVRILNDHMEIPDGIMLFVSYGRWLVLSAFFISILGMIYTLLPNTKIKFREALPGVIFTMIGWMCLSLGFSIFVRYFMNISFVYGSLGTVITLMIWLYCVGILLMLGSELNAVLMAWQKSSRKVENS